jgi:hypothetical protein
MTSRELLVKILEQTYSQQETRYNLTVSNQALIGALKGCLPNFNYERHYDLALVSQLAVDIKEPQRSTLSTLNKMHAQIDTLNGRRKR